MVEGLTLCQSEVRHQIVMSFSQPVAGCLLKKGLQNGATGTREPLSYAPDSHLPTLVAVAKERSLKPHFWEIYFKLKPLNLGMRNDSLGYAPNHFAGKFSATMPKKLSGLKEYLTGVAYILFPRPWRH